MNQILNLSDTFHCSSHENLRRQSFLSPLVKLSVLLHFKRDDLVFQSLGTVTQVIIQFASIQTKHGQGHRNAQ